MRQFIFDRQLAFFKEPGEQHSVMLHFEPAAVLWVLVLERVEGMRVRGHNALELRLAKGLQVLLDQLLEETFLSDAAYIVACVGLVLVKDAKVRLRTV